MVAEVSAVLYRKLFRFRFPALVGSRLIIIHAVQAAMDVRPAAGTGVVAKNLLIKFQRLAAMMTESSFHD